MKSKENSKLQVLIPLIIIAFILLIIIFNSFTAVPTGYVGVRTCFG